MESDPEIPSFQRELGAQLSKRLERDFSTPSLVAPRLDELGEAVAMSYGVSDDD
jgi:hypothetical protein